jgi:Secretion system C-terminal sorting domain
MKFHNPVLILILFCVSLSFGQTDIPNKTFSANLNPFPDFQKKVVQNDTLRILAVMVSFQADRDGTTFGNGKFESIYSQNYGTDILDPVPHNQSYFESHLLFVKNYFEKVSKGKLTIEYTILPDTFSVSQTMRNYSPAPGDNDFTPIGDFSNEVWTKADQMNPGFAFGNYDLFLIFHAGAGRDVTLPGSIGNERDLPSVYLSEKAFKEIYGENFSGIPVSSGTFNIKNTLVIPETESRELETITGSFLFELTINGLLCASIASHLGLPDLFDTETGLSAIGRFGLMDGQSIFAYNGCYPPEPSPWSKIFLGWADPVTLSPDNHDINLVTDIASSLSDTVILKVPLNSSEYFLVENRIRDANNDGSKVTYFVNGNTLTHTFTKDTTGYYSFDTDSLAGVVTDVDEFDWTLPGNGIVIWHIDENVIDANIDDNKINVDKNHRGVDVEEADGIQDIGERFVTIFGDEVIGEGTDEDFWYSSNPATLFQNRFAKDTRPNTNTNSGANSLITFKDFSDISNRMSFKVEYGDSIIKPLFTKSLSDTNVPIYISANVFNNNPELFIGKENNSIFVYRSDSLIYQNNSFSDFKLSVLNNNNVLHQYGSLNQSLQYHIFNESDSTSGNINVGNKITAPIAMKTSSSVGPELLIGTDQGNILTYSIADIPNIIPEFQSSFDIDTTNILKKIAVDGNYFSSITNSKISILPPEPILQFFDTNSFNFPFTAEHPVDLALTKDINGNYINIILTSLNKFYIIESGNFISGFSTLGSDAVNSFALMDLKQDGSNYITLNNGNNIEAYNLTGALADNFPFTDPNEIGFVGTPLTADFEGDNASEIISVTKDGRIFAIDGGTGKVVPGFPISCGGSVSVTPVLYNANGKTNLAVINDQNVLSAWSISSVEGKLYWSEENGNPQNTSFVDVAENNNHINEFFPKSRAYNYPNPVYEGSTNIRYYVSEDSKINIKIFDLAGDYVDELNDNATGGLDNETVWDVKNIQSGVYLARIEAVSTSGKSEQAIIKIAVVK